MLEAYQATLDQLKEKRETQLKPEERLEERKVKEVVQVADSLSSEGAVKEIGGLKLEIGKMLTQVSDRLEDEVEKFKKIQKAIEIKEKELKELYEIERAAATLAALIESQNQKRQQFESETVTRKEELEREIQTTRVKWEKEKKDREAELKEREGAEQKRRERDKEEYSYSFKREQQLAKDRFDDEKAKLEKAIQLKKEQLEKELAEREKAIVEKENELSELRKKISAFPTELEAAVNKAVKQATELTKLEAKSREELLRREFEGERNVLTTKIDSLTKTVTEQSEQIARISQQLEKAYQKVQDIAIKAIEGSSNFKSMTSFQQLLTEQARKQPQEK
jgi:uncharacterized coiled-coil protein SlyX